VDGMALETGRTAAQLVFEGGLPRHIIIEPRLILRHSTGPAPKR
jgi:hypothetical protein